MSFKLRHYQVYALRQVIELFMQGLIAVLVVSPTGSGKTVIAAAIIEYFLNKGFRILFVAHRDELITQCCKKLSENGLSYGVIKAGQGPGDMGAKIHVASVQTFNARIKFMRADYGLIIFDEAHHSVSDSNMRIIKHCTHDGFAPLVLGLTATPYRLDGKGLSELYQEMVVVSDVAQLIDEGFLVPPLLYRAKVAPDLSNIPLSKDGDYANEELGREMMRPRLLGHAVNEYLRITDGQFLRGVGFCVNKAHARAVCDAYLAAGVPAEYLDDQTKTADRREMLDRLSRGRTMMILNCGVLTEGFDDPKIEVIQALRYTKSRGLWRQATGRGARPYELRSCPKCYGQHEFAPDRCPKCGISLVVGGQRIDSLVYKKNYFLFLDHAGWTHEHGYFTDPDISTLAGGLSKERPKQVTSCKACGATLASRPRVCPECGAPMANGEQEDTIGLGDASVTLEEETPFFGQRRAPEPPPPEPYIPARPSANRIVRRSRGR